MPKVHFTAKDEPLIEGEDVEAICGAKVSKAAFVMLLDTEAVDNQMDWATFRNSCYRCLKVPLVGRWQYAVMNGQEAMVPEE